MITVLEHLSTNGIGLFQPCLLTEICHVISFEIALSCIALKQFPHAYFGKLKQIDMKVFDDKHIKNLAIVGASGSGKTTLAEFALVPSNIQETLIKNHQKNSES